MRIRQWDQHQRRALTPPRAFRGRPWLSLACPVVVLATVFSASCGPAAAPPRPVAAPPTPVAAPPTPVAAPPAPTTLTPSCGGPVVITQGGTYSGCWVANQQGTAVTIATSDPVTITNSIIKGTGKLVSNSVSNVKLTIDHTRLYGLYPGRVGQWGDYAVALWSFDFLHFEHNYLEQKGGVKLIDWTGAASANPVLVRYNYAKNIDGRLTDGAGGYSGSVITQFLQLDTVQNAGGIDVSWNEVHNTANASAVEDNINIYKSSGTQSSPINIHDNFIDGAYPYPATSAPFSGGGILLADAGGSYEIAHDNQVVRTTNYGVANASGMYTSIYQNRTVSSGLLPDGTVIPTANVGLYSWNQYTAPYGNNSVYNNVSGWMQNWNNTPHRNDTWLPDCNDICTGNTHLGGNSLPVTRTDEANEYTTWQGKLANGAITVGP